MKRCLPCTDMYHNVNVGNLSALRKAYMYIPMICISVLYHKVCIVN